MRKRISLMLAVLTLVAIAVGTMAFFTDRIDARVDATAGTLDLTLSAITAADSANLIPGYGSAITYTLGNTGSKSADVLETMVLNVGIELDATTPEFKLYPTTAVTFVNGTNKIKSVVSAEEIPFALSADKKSITFDLTKDKAATVILSGVNSVGKEDAEIEYDGNSNAYPAAKSGSYVLVFGANADNTFQDLDLTMYYMAQAKQHRNTDDNTWSTLQSEIDFAGSKYQAVVENNP